MLIFVPSGRDASLAQTVLEKLDVRCHICGSVGELVRSIGEGAGTAVIAEEALTPEAAKTLAETLEHQEPWSDFPLIVLTTRATKPRRRRAAEPFRALGNVTLVDRPVGIRPLQSTVQAAIRSRRRQYAARKVLEERETIVAELRETVRLNEMFVGILSHDLRNPLGAIMTGAELLLRQEESGRLHKPLARIMRSAERMARMIDQLLDFTRFRVGAGLQLSRSKVNVGHLCEQIVDELELANPDRSVRLATRGNPFGDWDADRLAQVVSNLIANSIQHGSRESPVTVEVDGTEDDEVVVRVTNQGVIPPEALPTLFDAFRGARERTDGHLGLGLYITQQVVVAHRGSVEVTSDPSAGTTFAVRLPRSHGGP